ncbi:MAG: ABC transporter permease [Candidatus Aminicenantes bacterium]|nr:ABC transporter permease [Candidatus Aminicenantes bacterium]
MRPPVLARSVLSFLARNRDGAYFGDVEEIYRGKVQGLGPSAADRWYRREALRSFPLFLVSSIRWGIIMLKNYLKTTLRLFLRDKGYSFLNVAGLAIGLACFTLLMMWVRDEVGWDRFHENSDSIYRLGSNMVSQPAPLGPYLKANYPEIADSVRFFFPSSVLIKAGDKPFEESGFGLADPSVFDMFTIPFIAGTPESAFTDPDTVVLTKSTAVRYFGTENPVGRVLTLEDRYPVRVTGVVRDPPGNSDIRFGILGDFRFLKNFRAGYESHWGNHEYTTYVRLAEGAQAAALGPKIAGIVQNRVPSLPTPLTIYPIKRIHLYADGAIKSVAIFGLVAVFILLVAAFNFINLTTARSSRRAREIAVRKVAGAVRAQLIRQFLSESILLALGAFVISLAISTPVLSVFNTITEKNFRPADLFQPGVFFVLLGTAAFIGLLSGAYPALLLSSFRPAGLLKDTVPGGGGTSRGGGLRKVLVVAQFAISIILMISTVFIARQVSFVRNFDLGLQKENIIVLPVKQPVLASREAFVHDLTSQPGVVNATFATSLPSQVENIATGVEWEGMDASIQPAWSFVGTDDRYLDTLGLTLADGRNFPDATSVQKAPLFIVNQKAVEEMKLAHPVGARFTLWDWKGMIIGVVKDFHFRSLREDVRPLLLFVLPGYYNRLLVKVRPIDGSTAEVLKRIENVWGTYAPGHPFSYEFLDAAYARNYQAEQKMGREFKYFSFLGMFISLLGLVGLAAYMAERKQKEIGIRKVLGATTAGLAGRMIREFLVPILLANVIAWPLAYWAMSAWLRSFAYRTSVTAGVFPTVGLAVLAIAVATVGFQTVRAARANPALSLKRE